MQVTRSWLYTGIGQSPAVVAVGASRSKINAGDRLLLVGDETALWLAVPLGELAEERGAGMTARSVDVGDFRSFVGTVEQESAAARPAVTLLVLPWPAGWPSEAPDVLDELARGVRAQGRSMAWVLSVPRDDAALLHLTGKLPIFRSDRVHVHLGPTSAPSAIGLAGWAGSLWQWIR